MTVTIKSEITFKFLLSDMQMNYGLNILTETSQNDEQIKTAKKIFVPVALSGIPQLFLINSNVWQRQQQQRLQQTSQQSQRGIEIIDSRTVSNSEIKEEPIDSSGETSQSNRYQLIDSGTPLPEFSQLIKNHLEENNLSAVWGTFVDECAKYYYERFPNIQNSSEYQAIGRKMFRKYPAIECEGKEPWSFFCKSLSQKIRHIKWKVKRKRLGLTSRRIRKSKEGAANNLKRKVDRRYTSSKQYKALLKELSDGWTNKTISDKRILDILQQTSKGRRTWLNSHTYRRVFSLIEEYPCFADGKYVVRDFLYLLNFEDTSEMMQRLDTLFTAAGAMMDPPVENISFLQKVQILRFMEDQIAFSKGRNSSIKSVVVHKINIPEREMLQQVQSNENSSPLLFIFSDGVELQKAFIAGDKTIIHTNTTDLGEALIILIATYYTFSMDYPKSFSQILGLLQTYVVGESYESIKSNRYTAFVSMLTANFALDFNENENEDDDD
ncbi:hypothetical protein CEXT_52902 [Caerostris extrusa]|uniref:Uncharacterized protein n=1 Tax=Caerostris extrusa TaxID=172846 RepID=A0AAV4NXP6_CAEEX|nr:hypothetical protein CEXT_52902 [Caerostris extrusa]